MSFNPGEFLYIYRAQVLSVYDGDTATMAVSIGFDITIEIKVRFYGINTPEMRGENKLDGLRAKTALSNLILGKQVIIRTHKDVKEKYGRYLAEVYVKQDDGSYLDVNEYMVENGYAVRFMAD